jgi:hypothetical protein
LKENPKPRGHPSLVGYGASVLALGLLGTLKIKTRTDTTIVLSHRKTITTTDEKIPKVHGRV